MQKKSRELAYNLAFDVCAFCFEWEVYNNTYCYFHGLWACGLSGIAIPSVAHVGQLKKECS